MINNVPEFVKFVIETLNEQGYEAYLVGGCVRDSIIGKTPKDWDVTTNARPERAMEIFESSLAVKTVVPTGIDFGTITVVGTNNQDPVEVTTFRGEVYNPKTKVSHKPKSVEYIDDIILDLSRRDFTMNAIAYDIIKNEYIDPYGGVEDISNKQIRCVGDSIKRFEEDPLRVLRAIRFASALGFNIDVNTKTAIIEKAHLIKEMSTERIREELNKILLTDIGNIFFGINTSVAKIVFNEILPELVQLDKVEQNNPYHRFNVFYHSIEATRIIEPQLHLRLAALFHDLGKATTKTTDEKGIDHFYGHAVVSVAETEKVLKRLKYDNKTISKVLNLIKHHDSRFDVTEKAIKKAMGAIKEEDFFDWCKLRWADITSQEIIYLKPRAKKILAIEDKAYEILNSKQPFNIKNLEINGNDIKDLGVLPGPKIRVVLEYLLEVVIENPQANNKETLILKAKDFLSNK